MKHTAPHSTVLYTIAALVTSSFSLLAPAAPVAAGGAVATPLGKYARERGFTQCAPAIDTLEATLLRDHEYGFHAMHAGRGAAENDDVNRYPFTAMIDTRRRDNLARSTIHLTVTADGRGGCSTVYEQTVYHAQRCDAVLAQMAPMAKESTKVSYGAILMTVSPNLSLTVIPVGKAECITIAKEAAFGLPTGAAEGRTAPRK